MPQPTSKIYKSIVISRWISFVFGLILTVAFVCIVVLKFIGTQSALGLDIIVWCLISSWSGVPLLVASFASLKYSQFSWNNTMCAVLLVAAVVPISLKVAVCLIKAIQNSWPLLEICSSCLFLSFPTIVSLLLFVTLLLGNRHHEPQC